MRSADSQLDVVVGQSFSGTAMVLLQRDCLQALTNKLSAEGSILLSRKFAQDSIAFARSPHRHLVGHCSRRSAGSRGVSEYMKVGEWQLCQETARLFEGGVIFTGKSDHHVRTDCRVRHKAFDFQDLVGV